MTGLQKDSMIEIVSIGYVAGSIGNVIDKAQFVALDSFVRDFAFNYIGRAIPVSALEESIAAPLGAREDRTSRLCYSLPDFMDGGRDYFSIKLLGTSSEGQVNVDRFMYLADGEEKILLGFFRLDEKEMKILERQHFVEFHYK